MHKEAGEHVQEAGKREIRKRQVQADAVNPTSNDHNGGNSNPGNNQQKTTRTKKKIGS